MQLIRSVTDPAKVPSAKNAVLPILAATLLSNSDGIFNDDRYDYSTVGFPFLAKLGRAVYDHELKRDRPVKPDLTKFKAALR